MMATPNVSRALLCCGLLIVFCLHQRTAAAQGLAADSVRDVDVCSVLKDPVSFDGQLIHLRGTLNFEFEGATVKDDSCKQTLFHTAIWWDYGGTPISAGQQDAARINAMMKPVVKDSAFEEFTARSYARRQQRPDGLRCNSARECAYYDVTATFIGRFFAGKKQPNRRFSSFGHKGCCHLFVIEQISNVVAERTPVPPDDQTFLCSNETWPGEFEYAPAPHMSLQDATALRVAANKKFISDQIHLHDGGAFDQSLESQSPWDYFGLNGSVTWSAPDLLTTYRVEFPTPSARRKAAKQKDEQLTTSPINVNVTRERCEPAPR